MRRVVPAVAVPLIVAAAPPHAAGQPGGLDVAVGYTHLYDHDIGTRFPIGWVASVGAGSARVAAVGEASGSYKSISRTTARGSVRSSLRVHSFLGGPRFSTGGRLASVHVQLLIGAARASAHASGNSDGTAVSLGDSATGWAFQPGGGVDVMLARSVGFRAGASVRLIRSQGMTGTEFQVLTGLVIRPAGR